MSVDTGHLLYRCGSEHHIGRGSLCIVCLGHENLAEDQIPFDRSLGSHLVVGTAPL